jgi:hypothetical protein
MLLDLKHFIHRSHEHDADSALTPMADHRFDRQRRFDLDRLDSSRRLHPVPEHMA